MMVGLILVAFCVTIYVIVSYRTPAHTDEELENVCFDHPLQSITRGKITGVTDPRMMAIILFVIMLILYAWLK